MAKRGIERQFGRFGLRLPRLIIHSDDTTPVDPLFHISPTAAPSGTAAKGDIYFDSTTNLPVFHDGTGFVIPIRAIQATAVIPAGAAATDYDGLFFIANAAYEVTTVYERHQTAGSDAGAVTLMVQKVPSGTAKASGTDILASGINLKATADTNQTGTLHATAANYQLAAGDGLGLVTTGTLTAVDGVTVTVWLKRI